MGERICNLRSRNKMSPNNLSPAEAVGPIQEEVLGSGHNMRPNFYILPKDGLDVDEQRELFRQAGGQERSFGATVDLKTVPFSGWLANRGVIVVDMNRNS
jgi:hypothetical protein